MEGKSQRILVGDVGGTNVRLDIYELRNQNLESLHPIKSFRKKTDQFPTFIQFIEEFLTEDLSEEDYPTFAVIGIAGTVFCNKVKMANTAWTEVDGNEIGKKLKLSPCILLNDFQSLSYGVLGLEDKYIKKLVPTEYGTRDQLKVIAGPGTGLGISMILPLGNDQYKVWPTEGGHANFAPSNSLEIKYLQYLRLHLQKEEIQFEPAMAGPSIPYIYFFIKEQNPELKSLIEEDLKEKAFDITTPKQFPSEQVIQRGILGDCPISKKTLELYCQLYENAIGDIICKNLPFGGIYLFGGLTYSIADYLIERQRTGLFMKKYKDNRKYFLHVFDRVPINIITKVDLGLEGSYQAALKLLERGMDITQI